MTAEGWIFLVGFRVFDVGLLIVWLVWFFRLRDDDDGPGEDGRDDDGGGPPLDPPDPSGGGGTGLLLPGQVPARRRTRQHGNRPRRTRGRGGYPARHPAPARVRRPPRRAPVRVA